MRILICLLLSLPAFAADRYYPFAVDQDKLGGAVDFSSLNHTLTPADRVFVRDGRFYRVGPDLKPNTRDDERVRFFGVNMAFGANFPEPADAARIAKRLRKLGVNLVRMHHMDTSPDANPENARSLLTTGPYPTLNPISVQRLRGFLDAFKAEGVYVNLNLHVGYTFRPDVDKIPALPEGTRIPTQSKPLHIFYPRMVQLQTEYTSKVISALKLKNDPVLAMVEIDNETSLLQAFQSGQVQKYVLGEYKAELDRQWEAYQKEHANTNYVLFLADRDRAYLRAMLDAVREGTDKFVPVAGTQVGYGGLMNLDSHKDLDYQDQHFYIDHYAFPHRAWDSHDWRIRDMSSVGSGLAAFLNMAASREAGKPYTVSEFNQPWPNRQAAEIDPTLAAFGAFQDWDSIMHFAYEHGRNWDSKVANGFNIDGDWPKVPALGQSAWLFRTAAVSAAKQTVRIPVSRDLRVEYTNKRFGGRITQGLEALTGYDPALALLHGVALAPDASGAVPKPDSASPYRSDTGELTYNREQKLLTVAAPKVAGIFGFPGTAKTAAGGVAVELAPASRGFVALLVTPLDGKPLASSRRMLLSIPGYTVSTQPGTDPPRPQRFINYPDTTDWFTLEPAPGDSGPSGLNGGGAEPVWMERVECFVTLQSAARKLSVYPLDGAGQRLAALPAADIARAQRSFRVHLQADGQAMAPWYEIVAE